MTKTAILHTGMHKTGTASIQKTLAANRANLLKRHDINCWAGQTNHSLLYTLFGDHADYFRSMPQMDIVTEAGRREFAKALSESLRGALEENESRYFLLSGETLGVLERAGVERLAEFILPYFDDVQIYMYAREPFSFANSWAQQCVKLGETFETIRARTAPNFAPDTSVPIKNDGSVFPYYRQRLVHYIDIFGRENVHVNLYEAATLRGGDVILDLLWRTCGVEAVDPDFKLISANKRLDRPTVYLMEALNGLGVRMENGKILPGNIRELKQQLPEEKSSRPFVFPDFDFAEFAQTIEDDVRWLRDVTNGKIDFTQLSPPDAEPYPDMDYAAFAKQAQSSQAQS